ncbi:MAG TPA: DUF357 domain-containing protein [Candidatus Nanoarchaeia archaeon]|nr:DUF357 domain-containing protein [Candidatus Nanoarchaeia archaeon]
MQNITEEKLQKYIDITKEALEKIKITKNKKLIMKANELLNLSRCYYSDSIFFKNKGDFINAFAAINYAHAFLDAGVILKLFIVNDSKLFMVDK